MTTETTRKPRLSAAERAAQRALERQQAQQAFEATRVAVWQDLWARAMRLQLLVNAQDGSELVNQYSWWFESFKVDAAKQSFQCEDSGTVPVTQDALTLDLSEKVRSCLENGQSYHDSFVEEKERKRREHEALVASKNEALAKLSAAERKLLNLPEKFYA